MTTTARSVDPNAERRRILAGRRKGTPLRVDELIVYVAPILLGTDAPVPVACVGIVDASASNRTALAAMEATEGPGGEEPFVEPSSGVSERRFEALSLTGAEAVQGHREVVDPNK